MNWDNEKTDAQMNAAEALERAVVRELGRRGRNVDVYVQHGSVYGPGLSAHAAVIELFEARAWDPMRPSASKLARVSVRHDPQAGVAITVTGWGPDRRMVTYKTRQDGTIDTDKAAARVVEYALGVLEEKARRRS